MFDDLPKDPCMMPTITGVLCQCTGSYTQAELGQLENFLALKSEVVDVSHHGLLHLHIGPGARAVAGPLCPDTRLLQVEILGDGENLRVVSDAVRHLLAGCDVTGVALRVDTRRLLGRGLPEEALAGGLSVVTKLLLQITLSDLDNSFATPGVNDGLAKCAVAGGSSDFFWEFKGVEVGDLGLEARWHGLAQIIASTDLTGNGSDLAGWLDPWLLVGLAGDIDVKTGRHGHAIVANVERAKRGSTKASAAGDEAAAQRQERAGRGSEATHLESLGKV